MIDLRAARARVALRYANLALELSPDARTARAARPASDKQSLPIRAATHRHEKVTFSRDLDGGTTADLTLMPLQAFDDERREDSQGAAAQIINAYRKATCADTDVRAPQGTAAHIVRAHHRGIAGDTRAPQEMAARIVGAYRRAIGQKPEGAA